MRDVLAEICEKKRATIKAREQARSLALIRQDAQSAAKPRGFLRALREAGAQKGRFALIAEIKKASPSKGVIREDFDPVALARCYEKGGAACLSVLTDEPYFQGRDQYLVAARQAVTLPVLRKDFMLEPYQIAESRALGADCILLILAALDDEKARELEGLALDLGMDVLIETHDHAEFMRATAMRSPMIGVNNRNLKTLEIDLGTTRALAPLLPAGKMLVCESGLYTREDLESMSACGAGAFLVGESLMRQDDVESATRRLVYG